MLCGVAGVGVRKNKALLQLFGSVSCVCCWVLLLFDVCTNRALFQPLAGLVPCVVRCMSCCSLYVVCCVVRCMSLYVVLFVVCVVGCMCCLLYVLFVVCVVCCMCCS